MGCGCAGASRDEAHLVSFPDGQAAVYDTEPEARAAIVASGGGTWTLLTGASATQMRQQLNEQQGT